MSVPAGLESIVVDAPTAQTVVVTTDRGATGPRGSRMFSAAGHPSNYLGGMGDAYYMFGDTSITLAVDDIYLDTANNRVYRWLLFPGPVYAWSETSAGNALETLVSPQIDFNKPYLQVYGLTVDTTFTAQNMAEGRMVTLFVTNNSVATKNLTWPAGWVWPGDEPTTIAASQTLSIDIFCFNNLESGVRAMWTAPQTGGLTYALDSAVVHNTGNETVAGNKTFTGTLITQASSTSFAGLNIPHGAAPSAPANGDFWTTTANAFVRINGTTQTLVPTTITSLASLTTVSTGTGAVTLNLGTGATTSGNTKTVNIGTAGVAGSTTNINLGSATSTTTVTASGNFVATGTVSGSGLAGSLLSSVNPVINGTAAPGTSAIPSRQDHVHPTDTSRAPLASPTFTGTPAAPTAAVDTNTTQLATTAFVIGQGYLKSATAASTYAPLASPTFTGTVTVNDLTVNGTTTTFNSTVVTVDDPVFTLGGDTAPGADDNKDRGIEFRWHNGTTAKVGFFGYDDSTGSFTFIPDATNTSEVFSGTKGTIDAFFSGSNINAGTVGFSYLPTGTTGSTVAIGNHTHSYQPLDADLTSIAGLAGTSGLLRKTAADTWSLDTNTYITGNQTITLSGDASGSGTTAITVTVADNSHAHDGTTISALDAGDTTTGTFDIARIPTGTTGSTVALGNHTHAIIEQNTYSYDGVIQVYPGQSRWYLEGNYTLESVRASVGTAPTGASILVDVNKNGTTIYGTQSNRPTIAAGTNTAVGGTASTTTFASGDYITVDIDQVGSTVAGSDLTVTVRLRAS